MGCQRWHPTQAYAKYGVVDAHKRSMVPCIMKHDRAVPIMMVLLGNFIATLICGKNGD